MPLSVIKATCLSLAILLLLGRCVKSLIVPEELPTILSLIYSNIPPIKKGTDSRIGVGFRLGEHADFQVLLEYGPQKETDPIRTDTKRKRAALMSAALKGNMGPLVQAVAQYQMESKIKQLLEKYKVKSELKTTDDTSNKVNQKTEGSDWLSKWSQDVTVNSDDPFLVETYPRKTMPNVNRMKVVSSQTSGDSRKAEDARKDLMTLKKLFGQKENEAIGVGTI